MKIDVALSNSFGFGGTNGTLVFRRFTRLSARAERRRTRAPLIRDAGVPPALLRASRRASRDRYPAAARQRRRRAAGSHSSMLAALPRARRCG